MAVISARSMKLEVSSPGSIIVNNLRPTRSPSVSSAIGGVAKLSSNILAELFFLFF